MTKCIAFFALLISFFMQSALAQYPDKPIRLIVPFSASGATDVAARLISEYAGPKLGQPIVVENKPGAGGSLGMDYVAKSKADGYTLGMATMSTHGANAAAYGDRLKYNPIKDFAPITNVAAIPSVFAVASASTPKSMSEFLASAKRQPGKLTFATPGNGSLGHINLEYFFKLAKVELLHIPYKGTSAALNDAIAGQVDSITDNLPSILPHIESGKLRPLAVLAPRRLPTLPNVPTYAELGFPQLSSPGWFGVVAPAGTPPHIVKILNESIRSAATNPEFVKKLNAAGATLMLGTPAEFQGQIEKAVNHYASVTKLAKISAD